MKYLLLLLACVNACVACAQTPDTVGRRINRLQTHGLLLRQGWRYHTGDNPTWARPDFDDSRWNTLNPTRPRRELPPRLSKGISWLRLRLRLGDSLRRHDLLLNGMARGAIEVYLNGRLVLRQGVIDADPARVRPVGQRPPPATVPAGGPAEQVLAVRYAPWQPLLPMAIDHAPQLYLALFTRQQVSEASAEIRENALVLLVVLGFSALLAFMHFAFFYYNPSRPANRYFAIFALTGALASLLSYCFQVLAFPTHTSFRVILVLGNILITMNGLWAIRALYALFNFRPGRLYMGLWVVYWVQSLMWCISEDPDIDIWWTVVLVVNLAEQLRLTVQALRQRKRGAGFVTAGFAGGLLGVLSYVVLFFIFNNNNVLLLNSVLALGFVLPALGISVFLSREFALDSEMLQVKLGEVERLSAQTLAQEKEKQALLAAQNEMLEYQVQQRTGELQRSLTKLRTTQAQLIQAEKMASLGELTAGIAHEIQNPLNFVNNFSEVSAELCQEAQALLAAAHLPAPEKDELTDLLADLGHNQDKITEHGRRAAGIVRGMLEHSRTSTGERQPTDLNALADEYLRLAYQGLRAKDKSFIAELKTDFAPGLPLVQGVGADLGRVLLNLCNNAFYAVQQRQQTGEAGYVPTLRVRTTQIGQQVQIQVSDNGTGMSEAVQQKIFQPFFTTKPTGEGTGLGLSLSYHIIAQGHGGTLRVESQEGQGTTFTMALPLNEAAYQLAT